MNFILGTLFAIGFSQNSLALEVCGITVNSENSEYFIAADGKSSSEVGFRAVMPYLKYHYTSDALTSFILLGEYELNPEETEFLRKDDIRSLAPGLIEKIKESTPEATFTHESGKLIVDDSSRIELDFEYKLNDRPMLESRLLLFQSPSCRIDAVFVTTDGDKATMDGFKNELIASIHKNGKGKLWILPEETTWPPKLNLNQFLIMGFVGSLAGFFILFIVDRRKRSNSDNKE